MASHCSLQLLPVTCEPNMVRTWPSRPHLCLSSALVHSDPVTQTVISCLHPSTSPPSCLPFRTSILPILSASTRSWPLVWLAPSSNPPGLSVCRLSERPFRAIHQKESLLSQVPFIPYPALNHSKSVITYLAVCVHCLLLQLEFKLYIILVCHLTLGPSTCLNLGWFSVLFLMNNWKIGWGDVLGSFRNSRGRFGMGFLSMLCSATSSSWSAYGKVGLSAPLCFSSVKWNGQWGCRVTVFPTLLMGVYIGSTTLDNGTCAKYIHTCL